MSNDVFYDVPLSTPGTMAFAPLVDGDLVPDYPVNLGEGRSVLSRWYGREARGDAIRKSLNCRGWPSALSDNESSR